jgi:HAD superfamily hydrolase (TIGR01484 family)
MTKLKLICVDMDGTFLNHDMTYNRERFERLRSIMKARDIKFAVASGNQYEQLKSFYANPDELIFIAENGTYIKDQHDVLFVSQFETSRSSSLLGLVRRSSVFLIDQYPQHGLRPTS